MIDIDRYNMEMFNVSFDFINSFAKQTKTEKVELFVVHAYIVLRVVVL